MTTKTDSIFEVLAEGLDACVDEKRGWTAKHERAKNLANTAPELLEACKLALISVVDPADWNLRARPALMAAIRKAEGEL